MERFLGLQDFGILPVIGFVIIVALLVSAFKGGNGKGNGSGNSSSSGSSNNSTTPTA